MPDVFYRIGVKSVTVDVSPTGASYHVTEIFSIEGFCLGEKLSNASSH